MILVDSSVWFAHLRGLDTEPVRRLNAVEGPDEVLVGDLILLELLQGARNEAHAARIERDLRQFTIERMLDEDLAVRAARHHRQLRERDVTRPSTWSSAPYCLERGHRLLHDDRDFAPMVAHLGLRVA